MPITLVEQTAASVPTPASGKASIFIDSVSGEPYYKDDGGVAHSLKGATGSGDVTGPGSSVDGHVAVFDGEDGKALKDGGAPAVDRNVVTALSISSGVVNVDASLGDYFTLALNANVTGWVFTNVPPACTLMYKLVIDTTAKTVAWPSSWDWGDQGAPTLPTAAGKYVTIATTTFDGGTSYTASWKASS